jgi:serine/threonine protein kinase
MDLRFATNSCAEGQGWTFFDWCPLENEKAESLSPSPLLRRQYPRPSLAKTGGITVAANNVRIPDSQPEVFRQESKATISQASQNSVEIGAVERLTEAKSDRVDILTNEDYSHPPASFDSPEMNIELSKAHAAWETLFGDRQTKFGPTEKLPFHATHFLGRGGGGEVHATKIGGIAVAWKRYTTTARRLTEEELNEAKIMEKMSKRRHHHVVELIGSYIHRYRGGIELGLLMWPVAHCNLASFLEDMDYLGDSICNPTSGTLTSHPEFIESVLENLCPLLMPESTSQSEADDMGFLFYLYLRSSAFLCTRIGCIGEALAFLHQQDIRHKDLKPAQILLSANGLWLTDFGWSRDTSHLTNSVTNGGDRITLRYHAPERAASGPCGKPEDIFALGCIYLEMGHRLARLLRQQGYAVPWAKRAFYDSLDHLEAWVEPLSGAPKPALRSLAALIKHMLSRNPKERPSIDRVLAVLRHEQDQSSIHVGTVGSLGTSFFASCCTPSV